MKKRVLIFPFRLPTWNQLYAMHWRERKKVRDWIHDAVLRCIQNEPVSQTQTELVQRLSLTDLEKQAYLLMIQPNSSKKYRTRKKLQKMMKL